MKRHAEPMKRHKLPRGCVKRQNLQLSPPGRPEVQREEKQEQEEQEEGGLLGKLIGPSPLNAWL